MFDSLLVANRGEIARRIGRTAKRMSIRTVAVYSEADAGLPHVAEADDAVLLGPAPPSESYLAVERVLEAAKDTGAQAVHPGYGFLSENAEFAQAVIDAGLTWVGPPPAAIMAMGDKISARNLMEDAGVSVSPGTREPVSTEELGLVEAERIGFPVMVKAAGGGGGIGMGVAHDRDEFVATFRTARARAERFFANPLILLEKYLPGARHVEAQILGLNDGRVVALGERDCSVQRRHQKVLEESPAPLLDEDLRAALLEDAIRAGVAIGYRNAGTVECLVDMKSQKHVFLEVNTRLQVEHPVTELVTGIDLVEQQLLIAGGEPITFDPENIPGQGHAMELRVYAEDPVKFLPSPGTIGTYVEPSGPGIRVDSGYLEGTQVSVFYDPLLAKLCVVGPDRSAALELARRAVEEYEITGLKTNLPFFRDLLRDPIFVSGNYDANLLERVMPFPPAGSS